MHGRAVACVYLSAHACVSALGYRMEEAPLHGATWSFTIEAWIADCSVIASHR